MSVDKQLRSRRQQMADDGDPQFERRRTVQGLGAGDSAYANLTSEGCAIVGIEVGDAVDVKVFDNRIVIAPTDVSD